MLYTLNILQFYLSLNVSKGRLHQPLTHSTSGIEQVGTSPRPPTPSSPAGGQWEDPRTVMEDQQEREPGHDAGPDPGGGGRSGGCRGAAGGSEQGRHVERGGAIPAGPSHARPPRGTLAQNRTGKQGKHAQVGMWRKGRGLGKKHNST